MKMSVGLKSGIISFLWIYSNQTAEKTQEMRESWRFVSSIWNFARNKPQRMKMCLKKQLLPSSGGPDDSRGWNVLSGHYTCVFLCVLSSDLWHGRRKPARSDRKAARRCPLPADSHPGRLAPQQLRRTERHQAASWHPEERHRAHHFCQRPLLLAQQVYKEQVLSASL